VQGNSAPATTGKQAKILPMALATAIYVAMVAAALYGSGIGSRLTGS
jgi:hypothetical protein